MKVFVGVEMEGIAGLVQWDNSERELERRRKHYEDVRAQLEIERDRFLKLLPRRYAMTGPAQVFPVCIEVRLPGGAR